MSMFPTGYTSMGGNPRTTATPVPTAAPKSPSLPKMSVPTQSGIYSNSTPSYVAPAVQPWTPPFQISDIQSLVEKMLAGRGGPLVPPQTTTPQQGFDYKTLRGTNYMPVGEQGNIFTPGAYREAMARQGYYR